MYNDTLTVANKIISDSDLYEIFQKMNEDLQENIRICKEETEKNEKYERSYQHWTTKDFRGSFKCNVNFYDASSVSFDNYESFISIFNSRLHDIKYMSVDLYYSYDTMENGVMDIRSKRISLTIYENKMSIAVDLSSNDTKMNDVYNLIKEKILNAPEKYDRIIKKRSSICTKVMIAQGLIPSIVICTLLVFVPAIRNLFGTTYFLYPIAVLLFGFMIGGTIFSRKMDYLYSTILPDRKFAGYDSKTYNTVYKDDIDSYVNSSEIIIGKNVDNFKKREEIREIDEKCSRLIPIELVVILGISVVIVFITNILS